MKKDRAHVQICAVCAIGVASLGAALNAQAAPPPPNVYAGTILVSDGAVPAPHIDAHLVNPWGIAFNPVGFVWVANEGTGTSTLYDGNGVPQSLVVEIPGPEGEDEEGEPTGIVFNGSEDFVVSSGATAGGPVSGPAFFIFVTENGTISGWNPAVDPTHAILVVDNAEAGAVYFGVAIANNGSGNRLYATNFHEAKVEVYDADFMPISVPGNFEDRKAPRGYAPFGIQNIGGVLYVTYAKQNEDADDEVTGQSLGFVNVFDANGFNSSGSPAPGC